MQALRPKFLPRYTGYVCSSCISKLRAPVPPPLRRNVTTQTSPDGRPRKPRSKKPKATTLDESDDVVIRRFDETPDGELLPESENLERLEVLVDDRIKALEAELKGLKALEAGHQYNKSNKTNSEDGNRKKSQQQALLHKLSFGQDPLLESAAMTLQESVLQNVTVPLQGFPEDSRLPIIYLNRQLEVMAGHYSGTEGTELWRRYSRCRRLLMSRFADIPDNTWKALWTTFSVDSPSNVDRMSHIKQLGKDMEAAGVQPEPEQLLLYIEACFVQGAHDSAIQRWETSQTILTANSCMESQYWGLGARMLAHHNRPEQAQYAANVLLNQTHGEKDARVLVPIIASWLSSSDQHAVQRAWAMYIRLRVHLGSRMVMEDYDSCVGVFMTAQRTDLALAVFRDMMLRGQSPENLKSNETPTLYKTHLRLSKDLRIMELEPTELTWTGYPPFLYLPRAMQNKYFYGSWIKKLLGDGEVDWAAQVVEFMYDKHRTSGLRPDPMHVNGILGAWLRSGISSNEQKAEDMAWRMIGERMDVVKTRVQAQSLSETVRTVMTSGKSEFTRTFSVVPMASATVETFSLLAEYYRIRNRQDRVFELYGTMRAAQIAPNTYFMNILLKTAATAGRKTWAWSLYQDLVEKRHLRPDQATFESLWKMMKDHVDPVKNRTRAGYPSCRTLFSEMVKRAESLHGNQTSRKLYERIILSFGLDDDQIGSGIALRAMQVLLQAYPDEKTIRTIILQLAKAGAVNAQGFRTRRLNLNRQAKDRIANIGQLLKKFKDERAEILQLEGKDHDSLEGKAKAEENILLLCDVLQFVVQARTTMPDQLQAPNALPDGDSVNFQQLAIVAAQQMGIPQTMGLPWSSKVRQIS